MCEIVSDRPVSAGPYPLCLIDPAHDLLPVPILFARRLVRSKGGAAHRARQVAPVRPLVVLTVLADGLLPIPQATARPQVSSLPVGVLRVRRLTVRVYRETRAHTEQIPRLRTGVLVILLAEIARRLVAVDVKAQDRPVAVALDGLSPDVAAGRAVRSKEASVSQVVVFGVLTLR